MMAWDYRKMLEAFFNHLQREEGTDFLNYCADENLAEFGLDSEEIEELRHVAGLIPPTETPPHA